jgi:predicted NBD/HSP70 family sugar kinase
MISLEGRVPAAKSKRVLEQVLSGGVVSKQELIEACHISSSTMTRILEELEGLGLIQEAGLGLSTGGRKPILFELNPDYGYVLGLDISRYYSHLMLFDFALNKLEERRWLMGKEMNPDTLLQAVIETVKEFMAKRSIRQEQLIGMGIGAVGPLHAESGVILEPLYFPADGWKHVPIVGWLTTALDIPVILDNGANAAVFGEYCADLPRSSKHLLYLHAGVGLRSAMISNGRIVYGAFDMEGSVGQMVIDPNGAAPREAWGNRGALESYASIYGLERAANHSFSELVPLIEREDPEVLKLLEEAARYLGIGIANIVNVVHPEKVILGGPLVTIHPLVFQIASKTAFQHICYFPSSHVQFTQGALGEDALAAGAAELLRHRLAV